MKINETVYWHTQKGYEPIVRGRIAPAITLIRIAFRK